MNHAGGTEITKERVSVYTRVLTFGSQRKKKHSKAHRSFLGPTEAFLDVSKHDASPKHTHTAPVYPHVSLLLLPAT